MTNNGITLGDIIGAGIKAYSSSYNPTHPSAAPPATNSPQNPPSTYTTLNPSYPSIHLPDPFKNHIYLSNWCFTAACLANLTHTGVVHAFACQQIASLFHDHSFSPSMFSHLEPDLQPCAAQILQPYPLYIDALPFPSLWERIIAVIGGGAEDVQ